MPSDTAESVAAYIGAKFMNMLTLAQHVAPRPEGTNCTATCSARHAQLDEAGAGVLYCRETALLSQNSNDTHYS